jgi:hypothetical protein
MLDLGTLDPNFEFGISLSSDDKSLLYAREDNAESNITLVENCR